MPLFKQNIVDDQDIQASNDHAEPNWSKFKIVLFADLPKYKDWARIEPDLFNYRVVGLAMALIDRFELVLEEKNLLLTNIEDSENGWLIMPDGTVFQLRDDKVGVLQRNPAQSLYEWERTQNDEAWSGFNNAEDPKVWMEQNPELSRFIKYSFDLRPKYVANPILLAVEMMAGQGVYAYTKQVSPKFQSYIMETIRKAYRHQLNLIDSGSWR